MAHTEYLWWIYSAIYRSPALTHTLQNRHFSAHSHVYCRVTQTEKFLLLSCSIKALNSTAITVLVWDESLMSDHHVQQEGPSTSGLIGQWRSQPRSSGNRRVPAVDAKLKKKLASLEETETKTKNGSTKQKQTQMGKK